jgi:VIT1/CCC1 family predicted Fe2+/Mn2+ transporter
MQKNKYNWLPDFVYGSIDGVVTTFAVVSGVQGASLSITVVLILGFANLFGDGFSMAVGKYLSDKAELDHLSNNDKTDDTVQPLKGALYTFVSFNVVGLVPLIGYLIGPGFGWDNNTTFITTCVATLVALFCIGIVKAHMVSTSKIFAGLQTMSIGGVAAAISYYVGYFIEKLI